MLLFLLMIQRNYKIKNEQKVPQKAVIIKKFQKITTKRVISFCTIIIRLGNLGSKRQMFPTGIC